MNNIAASAAGAPLKAAQQKRAKRKETKGANAGHTVRDEYTPTVSQTEATEAVRSAEDSTHEETLEDRQTHAKARNQSTPHPDKKRPRLDLSA